MPGPEPSYSELRRKLRGAMVAIITPFNNGSIDEEKLRQLIEFQIVNGTKAIIPCGTTGESATLTHEEHNRVIALTVEQVKGRIPVIAGTGSNDTAEAIRLTEKAKADGADAALLICPYYNKPTQEGLHQHFKKVAETVDIPIFLYNIQGRTGINMEPATVVRLSELPNIIGIKEASGNLKQAADIISQCPEEFIVVSGEDYLTYPMLCIGGQGVISVVSNAAPRDMAALCQTYFDGKIEEARKMFYKLMPLCNALFYETNPAPVKAALAMMGKIASDELRLPLVQMSEVNRKRLEDALKDYGLI
ncbi:MAG: 4-hydroxy-tetrahydrodipicolinate synthase [Patescibacteria group bacterium]|jgi:4-hydroxy-tetrahydrodipicolinate synthase